MRVHVDTGKLNAQPSGNFFDLLPGQSNTIVFPAGSSLKELRRNIHVMSLADALSSTQ